MTLPSSLDTQLDIEMPDEIGPSRPATPQETLFWAAVKAGDVSGVQAALRSDPSLARPQEACSQTPLIVATQRRDIAMVKCLLPFSDVNATTPTGETALLCATTPNPALEALHRLLAAHSDLRQIDNASGRTALMHAVNRGTPEMVRALLEGSDHTHEDANSATALTLAVESGDVEKVVAVLPFANPRHVTRQGHTPLLLAVGAHRSPPRCLPNSAELLGILLPHCEASVCDADARSVLMHAALTGDVASVKLLLSYLSHQQALAKEETSGRDACDMALEAPRLSIVDCFAGILPLDRVHALAEKARLFSAQEELPQICARSEREELNQVLSPRVPASTNDSPGSASPGLSKNHLRL